MPRQEHFPARHYEGTASGPFSFLNPTERLRKVPVGRHSSHVGSQNSQDTLRGDDATDVDAEKTGKTDHGDEMRAKGVEHKWRSRDNRKGTTMISEVVSDSH